MCKKKSGKTPGQKWPKNLLFYFQLFCKKNFNSDRSFVTKNILFLLILVIVMDFKGVFSGKTWPKYFLKFSFRPKKFRPKLNYLKVKLPKISSPKFLVLNVVRHAKPLIWDPNFTWFQHQFLDTCKLCQVGFCCCFSTLIIEKSGKCDFKFTHSLKHFFFWI